MTDKTATKRHPGRRPAAPQKTKDKHERLIRSAEKSRRETEQKAKDKTNVLAKRIDTAMAAGVETNFIADVLGISRQMVYKLVRERVDQVPMGKNGNKPD